MALKGSLSFIRAEANGRTYQWSLSHRRQMRWISWEVLSYCARNPVAYTRIMCNTYFKHIRNSMLFRRPKSPSPLTLLDVKHTCPTPPSPFHASISVVRYLSINYPICRFVLKLKRRELKAVVLMASQKTLPVSVTVIGFLSAVGGEGLMTVPCIVGHMSQLFIDSYISSRWAADTEEEEPSGAAVTGTDV